MRNMSLLELLFALLLVCMLAGTGAVAALVWNLVRRADGQALAHLPQSMQRDVSRRMLSGLANPANPIRAPYGHR